MKSDKQLKLNLGCGLDKREGWINVDALAELNPDIVHDLHEPLPFKSNTISEVLAQDILEHFTLEDVSTVVSEISRVMKVGGSVTVRVPNIDDIIDRFASDQEVRNQFIYGTTSQTGIFGAHKVGFTPKLLTSILLLHGLELTNLRKETTNFVATFKKVATTPEVKNIVYINQSLGMGGAEEFMSDLLQALNKTGIKVQSYVAHPNFAKQLEEKGIPANHIPVIIDVVGNWKGLIKAPFYLAKALYHYFKILTTEKDADIILMSGFIEKIIVGWWSHYFQPTIVWIEFGPVKPLLNKFFKLPKLLYYSVKSTPEKIIVPTINTSQRILEEAHLSLAKLAIVPCCRTIATKKATPQTETQDTIVCVSRLEKGKGQDLLIQAFKKVVAKKPSARLIIVGEGDFRSELEQLVDTLNLSKSVTFTGWVNNSLAYVKQAQICVFPTVWNLEGFGLVAIEAMAHGKPVVAFDRPPVNELVENKETGILVKDADTNELAKAILDLLTDSWLRQKLGAAGSKKYQQRYTCSAVQKEFVAVFNSALASNIAKKLVHTYL